MADSVDILSNHQTQFPAFLVQIRSARHNPRLLVLVNYSFLSAVAIPFPFRKCSFSSYAPCCSTTRCIGVGEFEAVMYILDVFPRLLGIYCMFVIT